jgi:hypothetical protein
MSKPGKSAQSRGPELLALWERAVPLAEAAFRFGDPALVRSYRERLNHKPGAMSFLCMLTNALGDISKKPEFIPEEMRVTPEERNSFYALARQIDDQLRARLQSGALMAIGFALPRRPDDFPHIVPKSLLIVSRMTIKGNKAEGEGLIFEAIRVASAQTGTLQIVSKSAPGRPSSRNLIKHAYEACCVEGLIEFDEPQLRAIEKVQEWIKAQRPNDYGHGRGLGVEAIRKVIGNDFAARAHALKL